MNFAKAWPQLWAVVGYWDEPKTEPWALDQSLPATLADFLGIWANPLLRVVVGDKRWAKTTKGSRPRRGGCGGTGLAAGGSGREAEGEAEPGTCPLLAPGDWVLLLYSTVLLWDPVSRPQPP
jgi:hypothetical protein